MSSFRDLRVWQDAMDLALQVYELTGQIPQHELYGLISQMRQSAVSIPSNIAEGWGRKRDREFSHFLDIAYGSVCELETQMELARRCYSLKIENIFLQCEIVHKQIRALRKTVEQNDK